MDYNYFDEKREKTSEAELKKIQLKKGLWSARHLSSKVKKISYRYKKAGVDLDNIQTLEDFQKIPFMTKSDFLDSYPDKLLCVEREELIRLHCSSGSTGSKPKTGYYTKKDLENWTYLCARNLGAIGVTKAHVFQNTTSAGLFTGGFGYAQGATEVGAMLIPFGPGMTRKQLRFFKDFKVNSFHAIPSFALRLANIAEEEGYEPEKDFELECAIVGAEGWAESTRDRIEEGLALKAYDNYGLTEACGPGVAVECQEQNGLHIWSDFFYPEIIDPETEEVLSMGKTGELVLTSLTREAVPIVRYKTGDITKLRISDCACGRTGYIMDRIKGRMDDMHVIKGVNVYPSMIEQEIFDLPYFTDVYLILYHTVGVMDRVLVQVELKSDMAHLKTQARKELDSALYEATMMKIDIDIFPEGTLPRQKGKAVRAKDIRDRPEGYKGWLESQEYNGKQIE